MGKIMQKIRTGRFSATETNSMTSELLPEAVDYGRIGVACEQLYQADFSQTAYLASDLLKYGHIRPETDLRVANELTGMALEKLGKPFCTKLFYANSPNGLVAENGETLHSLNERGLQRAAEDQAKDPKLSFITERRKADLSLVDFIEKDMQIGTTVVVSSACPSAEELGVPVTVLEQAHYQPELDQAMVWVVTKKPDGVEFKTINLFHAEPGILTQAVSSALSQPVEVVSREKSAWNKTVYEGDGAEVEDEIMKCFDELMHERTQERTFHGLTKAERGTNALAGSEALVHSPQFLDMLKATQDILKNVATSVVSGECVVPAEYLQKILSIKRSADQYELEGSKRAALMKLLNGAASIEESMTAFQVVHTAACSGLWATIDQIYHGDFVGAKSANESSIDVASGGLSSLESSRTAGHVEYGCPGDAKSGSSEASLFDMGQSEIAAVIFGRKVIQTNCPMCETKGVSAVIEHGTITCGSCDACVDICTGSTLRSARFKKTSAKVGKKVWSIFQSKVPAKKTFKWIDFSKGKGRSNPKDSNVAQKRETMKVA